MVDSKKPTVWLPRPDGSVLRMRDGVPADPEPLEKTLERWRKRASTGSYVDGAVRRGPRRREYVDAAPFLRQGEYAARHAPPSASLGDVLPEPCTACGSPMVVDYVEPGADALLLATCQNPDCPGFPRAPRPPKGNP